MMKFFLALVLVFAFSLRPTGKESAAAPFVIDSLLVPDRFGNTVPDFSKVGYMAGNAALPDVPVVLELSPAATGDDRARIQEALDKIGALEPRDSGFRGTLLLRAGEYRVHGSLHLAQSGVVLRGEGQFEGGTTIIATQQDDRPWNEKHSLIYIGNPERVLPRLGFLAKAGAETHITDKTIPVGRRRVEVENAHAFRVGNDIVIHVHPNLKWAETLGVQDTWAERLSWLYHRYERTIEDIQGKQLLLDVPMVHYIDESHFEKRLVWRYEEDPRISRSGVEHLRLKTFNTNDYATENHARSGVFINRSRDCWVQHVTALHFMFAAVEIRHGARNITVQDCAFLQPVSLIAGSRRYAFYNAGSMSLVQRCYARHARHAFASSGRCAGPNVFLDCLAEHTYSDIGPHMMWDTGYLYDNISAPGGAINVQHFREPNHRWRGANQVFWNCRSAQMICDQPRTGDTNWSIGSIASRRPGAVHEESGIWRSHGRQVSPRSLYLWQLEQRLGQEAVAHIAKDVQRQADSGKVHDYVKTTLAELSKRERQRDRNLLRCCPEFKDIVGRHTPKGEFTSREENIETASCRFV